MSNVKADQIVHSLDADLTHLIRKVSKIMRGEVLKVDAETSSTQTILRNLREAQSLLGRAILPCND